ncbi:uncharacterized protein LOC128667572 [Microplitis demolitor]|uniref:uncharacterized protein LOC128667572 n=1 Tax=Microplitis demolitor TaxID=69319 RepID=UPI00235B6DE7|nr:uncharacterized protein LOC128667572 [Microplitis demolitor]
MNRAVTSILCLILIISLVAIILYLTIREPSDKVVDDQKVETFKNKVKSASSLLNSLWSVENCQPIVDEANDSDFIDKFIRRFTVGNSQDYISTGGIADFACSISHHYAHTNKNVNYKICLEKIIDYYYDKLFKKLNPQKFTMAINEYALYVTRIFILYGYHLEKDGTANFYKEKCHPVIVKLLPKFNCIVDKDSFGDINSLWINTTRLLTLYLCDKDQYDKEVNSPEMTTFRSTVDSDIKKDHSNSFYLTIDYNFYFKLYKIIVES